MRTFGVALLALSTLTALGQKDKGDLARLIDRAKTAPVEQKPRLCIEIAEREVASADRLISADQLSQARAAVDTAVTYADQSSNAAIQSGKRLKDTEIAMRKMSIKLRDMKRKLPLEDQTPLQQASDHLELLRTNLLKHMFNKK